MKKRILVVFTFVLASIFAFPSFADDYIYFGGNYSLITTDGNSSQAIGANISGIGDYGGLKKVYCAIGFAYDITGDRSFGIDEFEELGIDDIETNCFSIPIRFGYPIFCNINDNMDFLIIPSLAFDFNFVSGSFDWEFLGYNIKYDFSGFGYTAGLDLNLGMQHKVGGMYFRYGIDFDMPFVSLLTVDIDYSGYISGSTSGSGSSSMADYFMLATTPYISFGFKF